MQIFDMTKDFIVWWHKRYPRRRTRKKIYIYIYIHTQNSGAPANYFSGDDIIHHALFQATAAV
jgi:hypothetical protein